MNQTQAVAERIERTVQIVPRHDFPLALRRDAGSSMQRAPRLPEVRDLPVQRRHALLLNPFYPKDPHASYGKHVLTPSLALTSLAGATPDSWQVSFWDENLLQGAPPVDPVPEVVGITVHLTFAARAYELAAWYRAHGALVVLGGLHAQSCPNEVAGHADAIAVGNGSITWPRILADVAAGTLKSKYSAPMTDYRDAPPPDRSILPKWGFLTPLSIIASVGCHHRCDFCYLATGDDRVPYQARPVNDVVREIETSTEPYFVFIDNNLGNRAYMRRLCQALRPLERIWSAAISIDATDDPTLVREMALAGCTGVFIGFESLTDDNLAAAGKKSPRAADYARRIRLLHDHGIQVNGSFVLGFDHDRRDCFDGLADWVEDQRLECATFHILTPYPGTPLFRRMKSEGRILHEDWSRYDTAHCVFQPKHMTPDELEAGYARVYERLFSLRSIWRRRPTEMAAIPPYLAMTLLYKRSNPLWETLIRHRLTHRAWSPLVELTRQRHLRYRQKLAAGCAPATGRWYTPRPMRPGV